MPKVRSATEASRVPTFDHLPPRFGTAMTQLHQKLGGFASKLDIRFDGMQERIIISVASRLEAELAVRLKQAGAIDRSSSMHTTYSLAGVDIDVSVTQGSLRDTMMLGGVNVPAGGGSLRDTMMLGGVDFSSSGGALRDTMMLDGAEKKKVAAGKRPAPAGHAAVKARLDSLVTTPVAGTTLPRKSLVYLHQKGDGIDPFGLFEEGLSRENENPLSITNESGKLEVSVGGFGYTDGEDDGHNRCRIIALELTPESQRYLLTNQYDGKDKYELLFNVDRGTKTARVWMREHERKWSSWEVVADYQA